jgi:hypothetical protein
LSLWQDDKNLAFAHVAQLAEHVLGKDEVISSILIMGSMIDRFNKTETKKTGESNGKRSVSKN